ncbi:hypothetical protein [Halomonas huangheensis]|uniref:Uncharacterized protein n=1 Tax=Halomonas huangheensis TaxID=1178482 RepID=W1NBM9_9GAMM|nr:hypothetical protein [Halomonas huangheensis]ALM52453.1 hypothetical protein AR456_09295 [Halomonas huangheensis]ERL52621.1 hypothetical protein BJB45_18760 [Halomonas huangheensis]
MPPEVKTNSTVLNDTEIRIDLAAMAQALYRCGGVLEALTDNARGLDAGTLDRLSSNRESSARLRRLLLSGTTRYNDKGRLVVTGTGRQLVFDMFGVGATDY